MTKYMTLILKKMCKYVGADYKSVDFSKPGWYMEHEWFEETENKFKKWLTGCLKADKAMREDLMTFPSKSRIKRFVDYFCFQYSWKYKERK